MKKTTRISALLLALTLLIGLCADSALAESRAEVTQVTATSDLSSLAVVGGSAEVDPVFNVSSPGYARIEPLGWLKRNADGTWPEEDEEIGYDFCTGTLKPGVYRYYAYAVIDRESTPSNAWKQYMLTHNTKVKIDGVQWNYDEWIDDWDETRLYVYSPVIPIPALKITRHPVKVTAAVGDVAKYTVAAAGTGLKYQWQYRNPAKDNVWKNSGAPGAKTATLSVTVKASYNKIQYRCVITDAANKTVNSHYASLIVKTTITAHPVKVTTSPGNVAIFKVTAKGPGLKYQWQYRNPTKDNVWKNSGARGSKTSTLRITAKASYNRLQYRCVITDANGSRVTSHYASLIVK